ncbi:MAG: NAD(P)/FAD-dependent oxidoreductase [Caulobacterales bacterium]
MTAKRAVVIGAGFAGLSAAYHLQKAGWSVVVLEGADEVGGRVRTVRKQGYTLDTGATQMSSGYQEYLGLCDELGLGDQMIESSQSLGIVRDGRLHTIDGRNMLSAVVSPVLSLGGKLTLLNTVRDALAIRPKIDVFDVSKSHNVDVETAKQYSGRRLSKEIYDVLVDPIVRAYVMNRGDNVSALEWFSALANLGGQTMLSLNGGNDRLPKAIASKLDVRLQTRATSIRKFADHVEVTARSESNQTLDLEADACVLATRLHEASEIYPAVSQIVGGLGARLKYNRAWVVHLGFKKKPNTDIVGMLLPTASHPEVGLIWLEHNKNSDRAPAGKSLFTVYSDEAANDDYYGLSDAALISNAIKRIEELFPELSGGHEMAHVTRWPCAIPNTAVGIYKDMYAMKQRLNPEDPVQLAGDYLTCTGQNSAIHYGRLAAENIITHQTKRNSSVAKAKGQAGRQNEVVH